jgi:RsiW-degrading membrane proteinase PrsW (M82 family)
MQWQDHLAFDYFQILVNSFQSLSTETLLMSLAIWLCVILITGRALLNDQKHSLWESAQKWPQSLKWLFPIFVVGLMARGTVTAHHLEFLHSEVSASAKLNEIVLNAAWTLDKSYQR